MPFHPLWIVPLFVVAFSSLWLAITGFLGFASGWYRLQRAFPDRVEAPIERLRGQSGMLGTGLMPARFNGLLTLDICPGGLRVSMLRLLGPFSRPFFVPWSMIAARRRRRFFGEVIELALGMPPVSTLVLKPRTGERIAASGLLPLSSE